MQPEVTRALLWNMLDAAELIVSLTEHAALGTYEADRVLRQAVERNFEIIGEAARRLTVNDPDTAVRIPTIPQMVAFRNVLAHDYVEIDDPRVWLIVTEWLPGLVDELHAMVD